MIKNRRVILCLIMILIFSVIGTTGCSSDTTISNEADIERIEELTDENEELNDKVTELETQLANAENASAEVVSTESTDEVELNMVTGINALVYTSDAAEAKDKMDVADNTAIIAIAQKPAGMVLDYWTVNGMEVQGDADELELAVSDDIIVKAMLREELKVTSDKAFIKLLGSNGKATGDKLHEYVFENDEGKQISVYVQAEVPSGYEVDYWLINGSSYYFNKYVTYFTAKNIDETTTYEVVLKKKGAPAATAAPTAKPTAAPTVKPTAAPTAEPEYVNVSCTNATFSGGGHSGATSGQVPKGTSITVTGTHENGSPVYWLINGAYSKEGVKSFSYTVNGNTTFQFTGHN